MVGTTTGIPALIVHGGAGGRAPLPERSARKRGLILAVQRGAKILREGGCALDAVVAAVTVLEDDPLFNAGYGSLLTTEGRVEMDAAVMVAKRKLTRASALDERRSQPRPGSQPVDVQAGGVVLVSRVRNPILLACAVMEHTPHLLMGGPGAERLARQVGLRLCRPEQLITDRARQRWLAMMKGRADLALDGDRHGTVGAIAVDVHGNLAAATSTGGISGKLPGRIGDSAIMGAGLFADIIGAASATGAGEAILKLSLCREAVLSMNKTHPQQAAVKAIAGLYDATGAEAGVIMVNSAGRFGYAHNAHAMEVAMFNPADGVRYLLLQPLKLADGEAPAR
jgi:beta-aspartyl-peptidase (threonine type)